MFCDRVRAFRLGNLRPQNCDLLRVERQKVVFKDNLRGGAVALLSERLNFNEKYLILVKGGFGLLALSSDERCETSGVILVHENYEHGAQFVIRQAAKRITSLQVGFESGG